METQSENSFTITIPKGIFDWLQEKIDKLNKKAIKLNCEPIILEILEEKIVPNKTKTGEMTYGVHVNLVIQITGKAPKLSNWMFIGKLEPIEKGKNLISSVPGYEIPIIYRTVPIICEHCNIDRFRKYTYLVQHETTKEIKQVGHSCLKDFLGHSNPEAIAKWAIHLMNLENEINDEIEDFGGGCRSRYFDIKEYLSYVAEEIKLNGWVSRSNAEFGKSPSADCAYGQMFPIRKADYEPTKESKELANKALNWIRTEAEFKDDNEYMYNLSLLCSKEYTEVNKIGVVASLISTYQRAMEIEIKRKLREEQSNDIKNEYLGNIKDKITKPVTVLFKRYCDGQYPSTLYKFITDDGYCLCWFASGTNDQLEQGDKAVITGTIKDHQEYQGTKQTVLTRCKIK